MRMFTENEFKSLVTIGGRPQSKRSVEITRAFNRDVYNPRDGEIVEATDHYAAFLEAYLSLKNGITTQELGDAKNAIRKRYGGKIVGGIDFGRIFADFD